MVVARAPAPDPVDGCAVHGRGSYLTSWLPTIVSWTGKQAIYFFLEAPRCTASTGHLARLLWVCMRFDLLSGADKTEEGPIP
ncbi:hypothetical protein NDU88_002111 [Pleurodeles waltl]|uniref:Uncharacterized protein n=1 Tax=Pleurodeles waltl TaxID=8319 RepID=A0AAV7NM54_PLEWA|nr:hypothetical protein NDU88_002111 [Pleurodeles waltl]